MATEFRKEALKKLSSPDDLDRLMPVTDRRGWIGLASIGVFILSAIVWGVVGSVDTSVDGRGITMATGAIRSITARTGGVVSGLALKGGEPVQKGQVLAIVEQPDLRQLFLQAFSKHDYLNAHQSERRSFLEQQIRLQEEKVAKLRSLYEQGLVEKALLNATERDIMDLKNSLYTLDESLSDAGRQLEKTREDYKWRSALIAPFNGIVTEVDAGNGDMVSQGQQLLKLQPLDEEEAESLRIDLYVASGDAKKIRSGMFAYVSPATVKPEESGYIVGRVLEISEYPVSVESIAVDIRNQQLAQSFAAASPPYKVSVKLLRDHRSFSGYRWTSGKGPEVRVTSGMFCNGKIIVDEKRPIELVIPMLKNYVTGAAG
jgi:HlyD family secretion protein